MATWEDGPEYAPLERPDTFADPSVATVELQAPPPAPVPPAAPAERPTFADPGQPVPPLASLVPAPPAERDPNVPFDVAASLMTAETSAWASAHFPSAPAGPTAGQHPSDHPTLHTSPSGTEQPGPHGAAAYGESAYGPGTPPTRQTVVNGQRPTHPTNGHRAPGSDAPPSASGTAPAGFPPPTGAPVYPPPPTYPPPGYPPAGYPPSQYPSVGAGGTYGPVGQPFPPPGHPPANGPFAAPGTPQWFGPGDYQQPAPPPPAPTARTVIAAATPGVLLTLVVGGFVWVLAPVTIIVAFVLSGRMFYGRKVTRTAFAAVLSFLGLVGLLSLITADGSFSQWWDTVAGWACFGSWVMIVASTIAAYRALKQGRPDPPPTPRVSIR